MDFWIGTFFGAFVMSIAWSRADRRLRDFHAAYKRLLRNLRSIPRESSDVMSTVQWVRADVLDSTLLYHERDLEI
jgi:hypothetical protein